MTQVENGFKLESTGREFYAYGNVLSVSVEGDLLYGWDGSVDCIERFTPEEKKEIAEHMIARWKAWAEGA